MRGQEDFIFRLSLTHNEEPDGQAADRFRIRIWNAKTSLLLYDQLPGADAYADPSSKLTGGSLTFAARR